ncbi:hypothetical protein DFW101_3502 [Solidesulfovibrio carbinoliphilus subsp. oakridgensis]|uniref:Phage gp6-like head-tail connector protein n=1 Tax=Solidesulfovibrio carbinoliphilus subsp. oakridgensis TaxID=694327 RepID=G7QC52_9BACT|nr:phage head-tail connector protein [Solidesulfovibrio carbinoliphilus]EHJ49498.1 hypothetical protein DFW101_3502 [Solidesulfovibrio carbinoliphilus subsp. oakridgensis]
MAIRIITPPASEPVTLAEMKAWARIDATGDTAADAANDALLSSLITAAREEAENLTRRAILMQTLELTLPGFPRWGQGVELPRPPLAAVESAAYFDAGNASVTMDEAAYVVLNASDAVPPSLYPAPGGFWPDTFRRADAVTIRYTAGWPNAAAVPENIKTWIKMRVATLWANRESIVAGNVSASAVEVPSRFADGLLDRWRIMEVS